MSLLAAVKKGDTRAIARAVEAGEASDDEVLSAALEQSDAVLAKLVELEAIDFRSRDDNPLHFIGYAIRDAYPSTLRNQRKVDPSIPEPASILDLRRKAKLLVDAGAKLDWEGVVRLGLYDEAAKMLAKTPKLAKQRIAGERPEIQAAWSGAWELAGLIAQVGKGGAPFDSAAAETIIVGWANEATGGLAKRSQASVFRRLGFDFDAQGTLLLAADTASAKVPGSYSHPQFADLSDTAKGAATLHGLCALGERALPVLVAAAKRVDVTPLRRTKDFAVLVFDHDEDEVAAQKRNAKGARKARS